MAKSAEHTYYHTTNNNDKGLPEDREMMVHVKIVDPCKQGAPITAPNDADRNQTNGREPMVSCLGRSTWTVIYTRMITYSYMCNTDQKSNSADSIGPLVKDYVRLVWCKQPETNSIPRAT